MLIESTTPLLLHLNWTWLPDSKGPHTTQLRMIGTSSLAMMSIRAHSFDQASCIHCGPKTALQPQAPDASVVMEMSREELFRKLVTFQWVVNRECHQLKSTKSQQ